MPSPPAQAGTARRSLGRGARVLSLLAAISCASDVEPSARSEARGDVCLAHGLATEPRSNARAPEEVIAREVDALMPDAAGGYFVRSQLQIVHRDAHGAILAEGSLSHAPLRALPSYDGGLWLLFFARESSSTRAFDHSLELAPAGSLEVVRVSSAGQVLARTTLAATPTQPAWSAPLALQASSSSASGELLLVLGVSGALSVAGAQRVSGPSSVALKLDARARVQWLKPGTFATAAALQADGSSALASIRQGAAVHVERFERDGAGGVSVELPIIVDSVELAAVADGAFALVGLLRGELALAGSRSLENGSSDLYAIGLDRALVTRFVRRYGGPSDETLKSTHVGSDGRLWLSGSFAYEARFGDSLLRAHEPSGGASAWSWGEGYVLALDDQGTPVVAVALGGEGNESIDAVLPQPDGDALALLAPQLSAEHGTLARVSLAAPAHEARVGQTPELRGERTVRFGAELAVADDLLAVRADTAVVIYERMSGAYVERARVSRELWSEAFTLHGTTLFLATPAGVSSYALRAGQLVPEIEIALGDDVSALALAADETALIVGTSHDVRIYRRPELTQVQTLNTPGLALALAGTRLITGDPQRAGPRPESGAVTWFARDHGRFVKRQTLTARDAVAAAPDWPLQCSGDACSGGGPMLGEHFGQRVALAGALLAVSTSTDRLYLFEDVQGDFVERLRLHDEEITGLPRDATQRWSVALDNGRIALGDRSAAAGPLTSAGAVYLLTLERGALQLSASFLPRAPERDGGYGSALAFAGDQLLIGAPGEGRGTVTRIDLCAVSDEH